MTISSNQLKNFSDLSQKNVPIFTLIFSQIFNQTLIQIAVTTLKTIRHTPSPKKPAHLHYSYLVVHLYTNSKYKKKKKNIYPRVCMPLFRVICNFCTPGIGSLTPKDVYLSLVKRKFHYTGQKVLLSCFSPWYVCVNTWA